VPLVRPSFASRNLISDSMGLTGLEPVTLRLSSACSNQLSYRPGKKMRVLLVESRESRNRDSASSQQSCLYGVEPVVKFPLALAVLLAVSLSNIQAADPEPVKPPVSIPPLNFQHETLPNRLEVYSVEDHSSPTVAVQVWYHVGSKDDPDGRSGFAHLFEHMMFKGNEHLKPDTFEDLTENIGGENNAYTADDVTVYHEVVPSNYLNPILWAEAERMSSLALTETNFSSERDVVKEEYRQRILANPYGEFYLSIAQNSFATHPYKRPGIGNIAELDASKLPEVRAFHSTFYRPDNATLIVVGDFQPNELHGWIEKYFGAIGKPAEKIPRVATKEPPRKTDKQLVFYSPKVPLPAVAVTYLAPSIRSDDAAALQLADEILSGGESSRLYQALVYEKQIAQGVSFSADLREDLGLLTVRLILASGKKPTDAEKALKEQLDKILQEGVTRAELDKAKTRFLTGKLLERETNNGKAGALGEAAVIYQDPNHVNTDLAQFQAVTTGQIKEVLNRYLTDQKKVVIEYLPEAMKPGAETNEVKKFK
jgi:zinc protease